MAHFYIGLFVFLLFSVLSSLYILGTNPLLYEQLAFCRLPLHSVDSFAVQKQSESYSEGPYLCVCLEVHSLLFLLALSEFQIFY